MSRYELTELKKREFTKIFRIIKVQELRMNGGEQPSGLTEKNKNRGGGQRIRRRGHGREAGERVSKNPRLTLLFLSLSLSLPFFGGLFSEYLYFQLVINLF